jgi:NADPH-dependent 2,4-dienoyl-CoA reductase/sulfur reductase-like enzyme
MGAEPDDTCDVAIVGGGPAGLAAATELRALGMGSVIVIEREAEIGGIPRHCGHYPFGMRELGRVLRGPDYAARLAARARDAGADIRTGSSVVAIAGGPRLTLSTPTGLRTLAARKVLLATGVREKSRAARMIGGTKPGGVLSTGALQGLVYLDRIRPFLHPVILGTELVAFSALLTCRHLGIRPLAMIEPDARVTAPRASGFFPRLTGTALLLRTELVAIRGDARVEEVVLRDRAGTTRTLATDGVIVTGKFLPEASLLAGSHIDVDPTSGGPVVDQFGRCSDPDVFAAGNLLRAVETAGWSWTEGVAAAQTIAKSLNGGLPAPAGAIQVGVEAPLKYVVPQRIVDGPVSGRFQLRVTRPANGTLRLSVDGCEVWSRRISALPERRILVPISVLPPLAGASAIFSIAEG